MIAWCLAVGDISGKGISAALLMATVHAFVRAYSLEPELALAAWLRSQANQVAAPLQCTCRWTGIGIPNSLRRF